MVELIIAACEPGAERGCAYDILRRVSGGTSIAHTEYGKPYFPERPELHFNISHTKGYAAAAFADCPVGVDIELLDRFERLRNPERFAKRVFGDSPPNAHEPLELLTAWTRLEAYLKLIGTGFRIRTADVRGVDGIRFLKAYYDGAAMCHIAVLG
jgi:4'-phosphopantetheinyl transferase